MGGQGLKCVGVVKEVCKCVALERSAGPGQQMWQVTFLCFSLYVINSGPMLVKNLGIANYSL